MDLQACPERSSIRTRISLLTPLSPSMSTLNASPRAVNLETRKLSSLAESALLPDVPIRGTTVAQPSAPRSRDASLSKETPENRLNNQSVQVVDQQPALDVDRQPTLGLESSSKSEKSAKGLSGKENRPGLIEHPVRRKTRSSMKTIRDNVQRTSGQSTLRLGYDIRVSC
jgi:hypothetical protein